MKEKTSILQKIRLGGLLIAMVALCLNFLFCAHSGDWAKRLDWREFDLANLPGEKDYPNASAIIILDEGKMQIIGSNELPISLFERHRIVKILNLRGQRHANITIPYNPQSQIENIQARTISPRGKIKVLNKKQIYDVNLYPRFMFYSDQRAKLFTMPAIEAGSVIEYRYQMRISGRSVWPSWNFQDFEPTLKSQFTLIAPSEWEVKYKSYNTDLEPVINKAPSGFKSSYTWQAKQTSALQSEFGMPSANECVARLEIAPVGMKNWDDVALWYYELSEPQIKAGKTIKELSLVLTQGFESEEEKLKNIYEWVRDQVRYIAVQIGMGGYQPHPAEEIFINRYGDCKDMTTLLCSLAREAGIEAYEVLVSTWQNGKPDTSLASPFQFNHAIAYCPTIGNHSIWMDATEKGCPFDELPWYDQGLPVLVVGKGGKAKIITTPRVPAENNRTLFDWNVECQPTGAAIISGKTQFSGALATEMREALYYSSQAERKQWLETFLAVRCPGAKLDTFQISGLHPVVDPLTIGYHFHTNAFAPSNAGRMSFCPGQILAFDLPDYFRSSRREHPIQFRFGVYNELNLVVNMPDTQEVILPGKSDSLVSRFGSASWNYAIDGNKLHIHSICQLNGEPVDPEQYQEFQNFLDGIKSNDLKEVVLTRK